MKYIYTILFLSLAFTFASANTIFEEANTAYKNGQFDVATTKYQKVLAEQNTAEVLYNLGNSYYKMGDVANAILHYEKALKKQPNDKDIQHNLKIANFQVVDKIEPLPEFFLLTWWKQLAKKQCSNSWTNLFLIILWMSALLFLTFVFTSNQFRKLFFFSAFIGMILTVILILLSITQNNFESSNNEAIIMASSISIKSAPLNTGTDLFIIHKGLKIKIIKEENDWLNIRLADGKEGWITKDMLEVI